METFIEIMSGIGQVLLIIWNYIIGALTAAAQWIGEYFNAHILPSMPTMLKFFSDKTINMIIFCVVAAYILIINITALCLFGSDKTHAKRKEYRISERRLMRSCIWGGAIGGFIGMHVFRHKTLKPKFSVIVPILFVIQLVLHSFILGFLGFWAFF